jgi:hypothetical protein
MPKVNPFSSSSDGLFRIINIERINIKKKGSQPAVCTSPLIFITRHGMG